MKLDTPQDIADRLHISRETVLRKCRNEVWPHHRPTPQTIVFTSEDFAEILEITRRGPGKVI